MNIVRIDLADPAHAAALIRLLNDYATGPTGSGVALAGEAIARLPGLLAAQPHYLGWLAWVDGQAVGLVNCFQGVSTFRARPLLNIHDIAVNRQFQRRGIATALLAEVEREARARQCCKITLEVLEGNTGAVKAYRRAGFEPFGLDPAMGRALFFEKKFYGD